MSNAEVVAASGITPIPLLRKAPSMVHCKFCGVTGPTIVSYRSGLLTWMGCAGVSAIGCILGCCLIPFCVDATKDVAHKCSSCRQLLAIYEAL